MVRRGYVPQRMCAGCGRRFDKNQLVRFTVDSREGRKVLVLDASGEGRGRGAYLCSTEGCLERALKRDGLRRRLGANGIAPGLREEFTTHISEPGKANGEKESIRDS